MTVDFRQRDRLESLKAGLVGASALIPLELLLLGLVRLPAIGLGIEIFPALLSALNVFASLSLESVLFHLGETALAGFLFGVTYRYAIRQDRNPQLKTGTLLAFALVRSLGQVDLGWQLGGHWSLVLGAVVESCGLFAIAALLLNGALQKGWIAIAPGQTDAPSLQPLPQNSLETE